uniref:Cytochrome c oxidase subunit 2 n=1 Tax=Diximermis spiculatus TaxID=3313489 RepID=Q1HBC0_9BILA|nr:cytochrome c oxidase subunit II [Strelkovimermis spiculatus]ABF48161.1 cytochrome c oxidase subunit 2 [Strelkovimermis spiculatus]ABF48173.1 cytochrome c oxidase subunit 2 [Strelkovimermis spiculatus]
MTTTFNFSEYNCLNIMDLVYSLFGLDLDNFNNLVLFLEFMICTNVLGYIFFCSTNKFYIKAFSHSMSLEVTWTLIPVVVLIFLGMPSLKILFLSEILMTKINISLKVTGYQWYWSYSFPEFNISLMSYPNYLALFYRLAESDLLILPMSSSIQTLITSQDVIHSWALPSLGFKMDACPGRLNYYVLSSNLPSLHIGQCSELCGSYHSWMPIMVEFTSCSLFIEWLKNIL